MVSSLYSSSSNISNFVSCTQFFEPECAVDRAARRNGASFEITIVLSNTLDRLTVNTPSLRDTRMRVRGPAGVREDVIFRHPPGRLSGSSTFRAPVHREGGARFRFEAGRIRELWVLGGLVGLDAWLKSKAESQPFILD